MTIMLASESKYREVEWFSSGIETLDHAIGRGLPKGRIIEILGAKGASKTSMAFAILAAAQKQGYQAAYIDTERKADLGFAEKLGVDLELLTVVEADTGEDYVDDILTILANGKHKVVVVDSIDGILPKAILEATAEQNSIGAKARLIAKLIRKAILYVQKHGITLILTNQFRVDVMTGNLIATGGKSIEYYAAVQIQLKRAERVTSGEKTIGMTVEGTIVKNQVGPPYNKFQTQLLFNEGFSSEGDALSAALDLGVLTKKGNTVLFGEQKLGVGMNKAREYVKEHPEVLAAIKAKMV